MSEWKKVKLGEITSVKTGKLDSNAAVSNGAYPFFTCDPTTLSIDKWAYDTEAILLAGNNASGNYTAKYYKGKFNAYQRTYIIETTDCKLVSIRFLAYAMNQQLRLLKVMSSGSTTKFLTMKMLTQLSINLPSFETQHRIATILSRYDSLIENYQHQIKLLEEAAQRLYKEWFVDLRFPGHENANIIDGVPEGWKKKKVGELISKVQRTKQVSANAYQENGSIPIIDQSRNFIAGYTDDFECLVEVSIPYIVFGDHTRILKYVSFSFAKGADGTQLIMSNDLKRMPQSLFYNSLIEIDLSNYSYARHFKYLKAEEILLPTIDIAKRYDIIVSKYYKSIQKSREQICHLTEARNRLLPKLMSGEIEV